MVKDLVGGTAFFPMNVNAAVFKPKAVLSNALEPSAAPETASTAEVPESTPSSQWKEEEEDELPVPPWKKVTLATALPDGAGLNDENHVHTAGKASVAASPPMMSPKSSAVAKASAVTGAPPQPAAVPKPKLFTTSSTPSTDLKPSAAADTMSLKDSGAPLEKPTSKSKADVRKSYSAAVGQPSACPKPSAAAALKSK